MYECSVSENSALTLRTVYGVLYMPCNMHNHCYVYFCLYTEQQRGNIYNHN